MCPSDANGVYSLPDGSEAVTGEVIQAPTHNNPIQDLASAMSARLMRSGVAPMTGPLKIADGSVGSPAIKFNTDGTTGIYKTTDGIGVSVGGTKVAEFTSDGVSGVRFIGELITYTGLTAQPLTVFPYGQTLSRTTYADLWAFAQTEIAAGSSFYNNGNGTTTFGIGDCRGRVIACKDDIGGVAAGRLPSSGAVDGTVLGYAGGSDRHALTTAQMPQHSHTASTSNSSSSFTLSIGGFKALVDITATTPMTPGGSNVQGQSGLSQTPSVTIPAAALNLSTTVNNAGSSDSHNNVQPTIVGNFLLFAGA